MSAAATAPFTADQLNRYRLTHPDKELRWVIRRLNRLPYIDTVEAITAVAADGQAPDAAALASAAADRAAETELARLDLDKWRLGVDRTLASVRNFQRQRESYLRKVGEAEARTEVLKQTLVDEKALLAARLQERDHRVKCDEVAKKIVARGKTRRELEEQIDSLKRAITDHRTSYDEMVSIANARSEAFARITALVDECRALKLPAASGAEAEPVEEAAPVASASSSAAATRLSAATLPFQPSAPGGSSSIQASTNASLRAPSQSAPNSRSGTPAPGQGHHLPSRPQRTASAAGSMGVGGRYGRGTASSTGLPSRPSALRNVRGGSGLEDGEVGESEDGEVKEGSGKRKAGEVEGRSTRARM